MIDTHCGRQAIHYSQHLRVDQQFHEVYIQVQHIQRWSFPSIALTHHKVFDDLDFRHRLRWNEWHPCPASSWSLGCLRHLLVIAKAETEESVKWTQVKMMVKYELCRINCEEERDVNKCDLTPKTNRRFPAGTLVICPV